jgi:redox-sensitive bicupin YhaK (pirin superfamily)
VTLPLERHYEHAALLLKGDGTLDGQRLPSGVLYYLGTQRMDLKQASVGGGRVLLIGGPPFPETILMWWNFVHAHRTKSGRLETTGSHITGSATFTPTTVLG